MLILYWKWFENLLFLVEIRLRRHEHLIFVKSRAALNFGYAGQPR